MLQKTINKKKRNNDQDIGIGGKINGETSVLRLSSSMYEGEFSALAYLYFQVGESIVRSDPFWVNLSFRKKVQKGMIQKSKNWVLS